MHGHGKLRDFFLSFCRVVAKSEFSWQWPPLANLQSRLHIKQDAWTGAATLSSPRNFFLLKTLFCTKKIVFSFKLPNSRCQPCVNGQINHVLRECRLQPTQQVSLLSKFHQTNSKRPFFFFGELTMSPTIPTSEFLQAYKINQVNSLKKNFGAKLRPYISLFVTAQRRRCRDQLLITSSHRTTRPAAFSSDLFIRHSLTWENLRRPLDRRRTSRSRPLDPMADKTAGATRRRAWGPTCRLHAASRGCTGMWGHSLGTGCLA